VDIAIFSRCLNPLPRRVIARKKYCWVHDIWLSPNRGLDHSEMDAFLCLSPWHKEFFSKHHGIDLGKILVTTNGIDPSRFTEFSLEAKDPYRFIYSSSPDRGLDCLLEMWPEIIKKYPEANLHVFYGFYNWAESIKSTGNDDQKKYMEYILSLLKQAGVEDHGRVNQEELAKWYLSASVWLMPEPFTETNCITATEAMASGCWPICSNIAALSTTVGHRGRIIQIGDEYNAYGTYKKAEIKEKFLEETFKFLDSRNEYVERILENREEMLEKRSWDAVASDWEKIFLG
jgi:glycosyltransferase involved in cell wall biosynthesis